MDSGHWWVGSKRALADTYSTFPPLSVMHTGQNTSKSFSQDAFTLSPCICTSVTFCAAKCSLSHLWGSPAPSFSHCGPADLMWSQEVYVISSGWL